jgi:hypothetical protein
MSTCTMPRNVLLHECTRHIRTLPLLAYLKNSRGAVLHGLISFTEEATGTQECSLGERA